eukprot:12924434-Prorocentrum_lima.AAC.1
MRPRPIRRTGRPRIRWDHAVLDEFWEHLQQFDRQWRWTRLRPHDPLHVAAITAHAKAVCSRDV